jgi:Tol biopolymer transport system component
VISRQVKSAAAVVACALFLALPCVAKALVPLPQDITFVRGGDVWVMDRNGGGQHAIVSSPEKESGPRWAPSGDLVAFARQDAHLSVWTREIYGTAVARLTKGTAGDDFAPAFSPDGRLIAFLSTRDFPKQEVTRGELYTMRPDGSGQRRITRSRYGLDNPAAIRFSPDGTTVAVEEAGTGAGPSATLVDLATGRTQPVISQAALAAAGYEGPSVGVPAWRPGATRTVAIAIFDLAAPQTAPKNGLFVMDLAPGGRFTNVRQVAQGVAVEPTWFVDGSRIAYTFYPGSRPTPEVWVVGADGSDPHRLATDAEQPDWRPPSPGTSITGQSGSGSGGGAGGSRPGRSGGCLPFLGLLAAVGMAVALKR